MDQGKIGEPEPTKAGEHAPVGKEPEGKEAGGQVGNFLHEPFRTLGQLKQILIQHLGEKKGMKFYNEFVKNIAMMMLEQMEQSADHLRQAEDQARAMGP